MLHVKVRRAARGLGFLLLVATAMISWLRT